MAINANDFNRIGPVSPTTPDALDLANRYLRRKAQRRTQGREGGSGMRVVGLDLSLTGTGVALASGDLRTVGSTGIDVTVRGRVERIADLADRIVEMIADDTQLVCIESPAFARQLQAGVHLRAGLWWQVAWAITCARPTAVIAEISPSALKKLATGRGNATKADMRVALLQRAGVDNRDDNQVDAYWLRQAGLHLLGADDRLPLPVAHTAGLGKLRASLPI